MIYMDNAATTRLCEEAYEAMLPYLRESYGNPGGLYDQGLDARRAVVTAREIIAETINAHPSGIYFTGSGTEADNWALKGLAELMNGPADGKGPVLADNVSKPHFITTSFEHHAVINTCRWLERKGCAISYVNPDTSGFISVSDIEKYICRSTALISVMLVNNELGTVQQAAGIGKAAHDHGLLFHTDAVTAYGHIPIDVKKMNIDMLSVSAHKFGGPKGTGFLYVNEGIKLPPLIHGGVQEQGRRAGTENVAGIAGMAAAAARACRNMKTNLDKRHKLDIYFMDRLNGHNREISSPGSRGYMLLNGYVSDDKHADGSASGTVRRLPGMLSITIQGMDAEELIVRLGMEGICISAGAACASSDEGGSHVLRAIGLDEKHIRSTVRISMNEDNTEEEIDMFFEAVKSIV